VKRYGVWKGECVTRGKIEIESEYESVRQEEEKRCSLNVKVCDKKKNIDRVCIWKRVTRRKIEI